MLDWADYARMCVKIVASQLASAQMKRRLSVTSESDDWSIRNVCMLCSELKLVTDNLLFVYVC